MGFRPISVGEKIAVLCGVIKKGKIEPVARDCGVGKQAFCLRVAGKIPGSSKERP